MAGSPHRNVPGWRHWSTGCDCPWPRICTADHSMMEGMWFGMVLMVVLVAALIAALVSLTVYLIRRSR